MGLQHIPVMVEEVMTFLRCDSGRTYVDATLGGGGHASEILRRAAPDGMVIGMEWDEDALAEARNALLSFGERVKIFRENFVHLPDLMKVESVDGLLLDLGLSSFQVEKEGRGFSFKGEGPLDMRMDQRMDQTAADLINRLPLKELEYTLFHYGEESWAKKIAKAIVDERERGPIETTQTLRKIVHHAIPRRFHSRRIDPATKTFQALRIRVNDELENLRKILETGWTLLTKGGRMCIISFHSLEDRMVKVTFRRLEKEGKMSILTKKPVTPSEEEKKRNPRSRSAKLRCAERV
ncbi:MAG: 16S rRNA (cytosine(1402)-N(4))-methyltransferase [Deltaproteobacteria bacterium RBG_16_47_11]|nr:MAG: 16S rRNA (cytosine(1402)-N(4))-methyltransferase [Deltaproteobacteria bacterium RBG_16_47_11]